MLRAIPLGGLGEIGLNAMVFESGGDLLLVDCGLMFPSGPLPGVDIILPDLSFVRNHAHRLKGVVLTHAHEDHLGALPYLLRDLQVPIYGAPFSLALLRSKLEEVELSAELREIHPRYRFQVGEAISVEPVQMCHSVPDALGFIVRTPKGTVVHTGDWKLDPAPLDGRITDLEALDRVAREGVTALFSDSTNAENPHPLLPERDVGRTFERLFLDAPGRVVLSMFASHLSRLQKVVDLCQGLGRRLLLVGRSLERNVELAQRTGHLRIPSQLLVRLEEAVRLPHQALCAVVSGSQAEPRSALTQMAGDNFPLRFEPGDRVILSARAIPGNERAVTDLIDRMVAMGAQVHYGQNEPHVHTSGHATAPQQAELIRLLQPRNFVPIHGEVRHLHAHLKTAREAGVGQDGLLLAKDGDVLEFMEGHGRIAGQVAVGQLLQNRQGGALARQIVAERMGLAESGVVVVALAIHRATGQVMSGPHLSARGLSEDETVTLPSMAPEVLDAVNETSVALRQDEPFLKEVLVKAVRRSLKARGLGRPSVMPVVLKL